MPCAPPSSAGVDQVVVAVGQAPPADVADNGRLLTSTETARGVASGREGRVITPAAAASARARSAGVTIAATRASSGFRFDAAPVQPGLVDPGGVVGDLAPVGRARGPHVSMIARSGLAYFRPGCRRSWSGRPDGVVFNQPLFT
jgi:hypothetical protein